MADEKKKHPREACFENIMGNPPKFSFVKKIKKKFECLLDLEIRRCTRNLKVNIKNPLSEPPKYLFKYMMHFYLNHVLEEQNPSKVPLEEKKDCMPLSVLKIR